MNKFKKLIIAIVLIFGLVGIAEAAINIVPNGGTGVGTITGIIKGSGTSAFTPASGSDINSTFGTQTQNFIYGAPSASNGTPSFRAITNGDIPALTGYLNIAGTNTGATSQAQAFTNGINVTGNFSHIGDTASPGGNCLTASKTCFEMIGNDNSIANPSGISGFIVNTNNGGNAYSDLLLGNDTFNVASANFGIIALNSSGYNNCVFAGASFCTPNQMSMENTIGGVTIGTSGNFPDNFIVNGSEIGRFNSTGLNLGTVNGIGALTEEYDNIGATAATPAQGIILQNQTAAVLNGQQFPPALSWSSNGWGTTAGTSQTVQWKIAPTVTQSTTPTGLWALMSSVAGSAFANRITFNSGGGVTVSGTFNTSGTTATTTNTRTAIAGVSSDGFISANTTASTAGATVQWPARIRLSGTAWDTTPTAASKTDDFIIENQTATGSPTTDKLVISSQINAGGYTPVFTINNAGHITEEGITSTGATGTGNLVFSTSPTFTTPLLGTPTSGVMTNVTGTATGLTSGITQALASATTTVNVSSATAPTSGQVLQATGSTTATWQAPKGVSNYNHGIFTPTTGQTVSLVNNQYNIINPAGALLALTVNLPSSPANNDVVYIKFTQNVTTVTYANGTVVDGITAPTAGGLTVLTYDSATTSWY